MQPQVDLDPPVNWQELLLEFRRWGWTMYRVAAGINVPTSTLMGWLNDAKEPRYEHGRVLLKFHAQEREKRNSDGSAPAPDVQPTPQERPMRATAPKTLRQPGQEAPAPDVQPGDTESNVDEAIAAGQAGRTRKIVKPRAVVAPSKIKGDPERPAAMPVNAKRQMSYAEAMKLRSAGKLTKSVLTELGWVTRNETKAEIRQARESFRTANPE